MEDNGMKSAAVVTERIDASFQELAPADIWKQRLFGKSPWSLTY